MATQREISRFIQDEIRRVQRSAKDTHDQHYPRNRTIERYRKLVQRWDNIRWRRSVKFGERVASQLYQVKVLHFKGENVQAMNLLERICKRFHVKPDR